MRIDGIFNPNVVRLHFGDGLKVVELLKVAAVCYVSGIVRGRAEWKRLAETIRLRLI